MSKPKKIYINGMAFIPDHDLLLCDVTTQTGFSIFESYVRIYATKRGRFYKVTCEASRDSEKKTAELITLEETTAFLNAHAPYIITYNYDRVFGNPERG